MASGKVPGDREGERERGYHEFQSWSCAATKIGRQLRLYSTCRYESVPLGFRGPGSGLRMNPNVQFGAPLLVSRSSSITHALSTLSPKAPPDVVR